MDMATMKSMTTPGTDEESMYAKFRSIQDHNRQDIGGAGKPVKDIPHNKPGGGQNPTGAFDKNVTNWTNLLESLDDVENGIDENQNDIMTQSLDNEVTPEDEGNDSVSNDELLEELNKIFTPILVMQGFEKDMSDKITEAYSEADVLNEKTLIKWDDQARMSQLIKVCALLISRKKNTEKYQMYKKASIIARKMAIEIQKDEYEGAKTLAEKYLVKVSTTNNNSVARKAAKELLPETQH